MDRETCVLTHDLARQLVASAVLAPSSHNSQPWIFRVRGRCIGVIADRTRALPANDPEDRELAISCGCALFNLRVAAAHAGLATRQLGPSGAGDPDCLGRLELAADATADTALAALFDMITKRRTYRRTFAARAIEAAVLAQLADAAEREGAWLHVAEGPAQRLQAAELIAEGDEMQWADPAWRRELAAWMHPRREGDGLTLPGAAVPLAQAVVRTFDMGHGVAARDRQLADASPVLAILGTPGDDPASHLVAGQALQRVLLTACGQGVQASYLNQAIEIAPLRAQLRKLCGRTGAPQILLRLGYPEADLPASPRRPLDAVIEFMTEDGSDGGC
jgi:nitroreductase